MNYQKWHNFYEKLNRLGISNNDANLLRKIEMTLHRWCERECNGEIERNEDTNKVYSNSPAYINGYSDKNFQSQIPDRETGALKRLDKIMSQYPELWYYYQSDPRGCALYVGKKSDIRENERLDSVYTRGVGVCL